MDLRLHSHRHVSVLRKAVLGASGQTELHDDATDSRSGRSRDLVQSEENRTVKALIRFVKDLIGVVDPPEKPKPTRVPTMESVFYDDIVRPVFRYRYGQYPCVLVSDSTFDWAVKFYLEDRRQGAFWFSTEIERQYWRERDRAEAGELRVTTSYGRMRLVRSPILQNFEYIVRPEGLDCA